MTVTSKVNMNLKEFAEIVLEFEAYKPPVTDHIVQETGKVRRVVENVRESGQPASKKRKVHQWTFEENSRLCNIIVSLKQANGEGRRINWAYVVTALQIDVDPDTCRRHWAGMGAWRAVMCAELLKSSSTTQST